MTTTVHPAYRKTYLSRMRLSDALAGLCWVSIAIVIALFFADGGAAKMMTVTGAWIGIGQISGLIGTNLLIIQLLLASRLPWIDRSFGHDRAMVLHRLLGKPVLYLILIHSIALTVAYARLDKLPLISEIPRMFSLEDMWLAFIGLGLLLLIVVTSLVIVRKRLDYDAWFYVHLLAYAAVGASIPHQFSAGAIFAPGTVARYYWIGLYVFTGSSLLFFRVVKPIASSLRHSLYVSDIKNEDDGVVTVSIMGKDIDKLSAQAGQFLMWRFWTKGMWWHAHPFSLSASPTNDTLRVTVRALGHGSEKIQSLRIETRVSIQGPYGLFTEMSRTSRHIVMVAAGIGIAPVRALLEDAQFGWGEATILLRTSGGKQIYLFDELLQIAERKGVRVYILDGSRPRTTDSWLPAQMVANGVTMASFVNNIRQSDIYICGPNNWSNLVVADAKALGVPKQQIHWERFNW